ncbi:MAG: DNA repair protein RecN, partial [Clostridia bacterium]|nr:DNA repair protein RecN [Clostridia bacterium]
TERYSRTGVDKVEFMFSSNLGFELKPLNKVVSGGEMSRVMLAYKIVVSAVDNIHTIVFDEIDTGLSGNIAMVVAEYMARLSKNKQIIAVSHLPQICAMADYNLKVEKYSDATTTHTKATVLTGENLYLEITRLMGAVANENAKEMSKILKQKCEDYKTKIA